MSTPGSLDRERALFHACLELSAAERVAYLDKACDGETQLRQRIERLLRAHSLATEGFASLAAIPDCDIPQVDRRYRIVRLLGEGGMGTVYEAEQHQPVQRQVAIKIIRHGMPGAAMTHAVLSRFAAERQALAVMDHPNLAKVFDAGETPLGHPFFVMELVSGAPLTEYCRQHRLPVRARIHLFLQLCRAVEHAHQKGVIHRDLKPANVLVGGTPADPVVKVIDFGIAKAVGGDPIDARLTLTGSPLGTPAYMSPEQASGAADVDTRSDIYSLGVILYELLTASLPADPHQIGYARFLSTLGSGQIRVPVPSTSKSDPTLAGQIDPDLDWIVLRALDSDRARRYPSASALADDLERCLAHRPVSARRPTTAYQLSKFIRRNRFQALAAAAAIVAVIAGSAAAGVSYLRAVRAEANARIEAAAAREVSDFLVSTFKITSPGEHRGRTVTARELLDNAAAQITTGFGGQPQMRQRLLTSLSQAYSALGLSREGRSLAESALAALPSQGKETLQDAAALLAFSRASHVLNDFDKARDAARRATGIRRRLLGPRHPYVAAALVQQAEVLASIDAFAAGFAVMNEALEIRREAFGEHHLETGRALAQIGFLYARRRQPGDRKRALDYYQSALPILEASLGPDHPDYAAHLDHIGNNQDSGQAALPWYQRALSIRKRTMGPDHLKISDSFYNIGRAYSQMGRFADAKPPLEQALRMREAALGPDAMQTGHVLHSLGIVEAGLNGYEKALPYFERSLAISQKASGPSHSVTALNHMNVGKILVGLHRFQEAVPHLEQGIRGGFSFDWTDKEFHRVRNQPRFVALAAEQERLRKAKPTEKQWVHPVK